MISYEDALYQSGMTEKLRAIRELGTLLQFVDWEAMQNTGGEVKLYNLGIWIDQTLKDLMDEIEDLDDQQKQKWIELEGQVPPDPAQIEKEREHRKEYALYMAAEIGRKFPSTGDEVKELIEQASMVEKSEAKQDIADWPGIDPDVKKELDGLLQAAKQKLGLKDLTLMAQIYKAGEELEPQKEEAAT
jgi:hypothetical protein